MGQTYVNEDMGNTLSARDYKQPQAVCYGMDNERRRGVDEFVEQSPTITSRAGTGENNVPIVRSMEVFHCTTEEDKVQTLKARDYKDPQVVAYGIEPGAAKRMNVESRYWEEKSPTLRATSGDNMASVACYGVDGYNQSATEELSKAITSSATDSDHVPCVTYGLDSYNQTADEEVMGALRTNGGGDNSPKVCYGLDRASFNQGQNAKFDFSVEEELAPTLVNRGPGGVLAGQ